MGVVPFGFLSNYNLNIFVHHSSLSWVSYARTPRLKMKLVLHIITTIFTLFLVSCNNSSTRRFDSPMDRATALKHMDLALPPSTNSVYFFEHVDGMQGLDRFIRLDVSPDELDSAVEAMIVSNEKTMSRTLPYTKMPFSSSTLHPPRKDFQPLKWWNPSAVKTGYYRGHIDAYALQILVDTDHSRIYIYTSD